MSWYLSLSLMIRSIVCSFTKTDSGEEDLQENLKDRGCLLNVSGQKHLIKIISDFESPSVLMKRRAVRKKKGPLLTVNRVAKHPTALKQGNKSLLRTSNERKLSPRTSEISPRRDMCLRIISTWRGNGIKSWFSLVHLLYNDIVRFLNI